MFPSKSPEFATALSLDELAPQFLLYAEVELRFAPRSILKYADCLRQVGKLIGSKDVTAYTKQDLFRLKQAMLAKQHSISRQVGILFALKRFWQFCRDELNLSVLDPNLITPPPRPRREVAFLSAEDVAQFVSAIRIETYQGSVNRNALRFRALVEALLGTAMRISELLSLNRDQIDFAHREARIVGKGNKERIVFFTDRALDWIKQYLDARTDDCPALFVCQDGRSRLKQPDIWRFFARYRKLAGLTKPVRPHLLRHTAATQLLFNGCPIGHIKEILGHERLETTCRYYLGLDHRAAKLAHAQYLVYPGVSPAT